MAVYWLPYFYALPVIVENVMMEDHHQNTAHTAAPGRDTGHNYGDAMTSRPVVQGSQHAAESPQAPQQYGVPPNDASELDMSSMSVALPNYSYSGQQQSQYQQSYPSNVDSNTLYQSYQSNTYQSTPSSNYTIPFVQQIPMASFQSQRAFNPYSMNVQGSTVFQQSYPGQIIYPGQSAEQSPVRSNFQQYPAASMFQHGSSRQYSIQDPAQYQAQYGFGSQQSNFQEVRRSGSNNSLRSSTTLRGPPRKPRQSGHALWVGNLPPGTNIIDLKDHFARDATNEIESVFLISKSNCAFVNYRSERSCSAAMNRFHDSRFMGARLVCRLRRGSTPGSTTTPSLPTGFVPDSQSSRPDLTQTGSESKDDSGEGGDEQKTVKERFFIIKSLTMDDLERSVQSGIWATQSHNEVALKKAFKTAESVYLIFSANKSGEYFGYARMASSIDDEAVANIELPPISSNPPAEAEASSTTGAPLTIPTAASTTAPKGYIIDDSARGTIFWEAETVSTDPTNSNTISSDRDPGQTEGPISDDPATNVADAESTTFGKPFRIRWMSTERLAFYRTRGLRNPWNSNREVKIARDGTELEPTVGRKLIDMFGMNFGGVQPRGQQQGQYQMAFGQGPAYRPF